MVKISDGQGASVQPTSHELVVNTNHQQGGKSEENNHWFDLRAGYAAGFCANQHDDDRRNDNNEETRNDNRDYYRHDLHRGHGYHL